MKVHAAVTKVLVARGVDTIFGLMGDANMLILTDYIRDLNGRYIGATYEGAAVSMAEAFSRVTGRVGVASVTHGPGLTNTLTALTEAVRKRSSVILITGDTPARRAAAQNVDIRGFAAVAGAGYERVHSIEDVVIATDTAFRRATAERLPIVLDVPADFLHGEIPDDLDLPPMPTKAKTICDPTELDHALGVLASAKRPVIVAGRGAVQSGAREAILELSDLLEAPLATTLLGKDYFRGHPLDLGVCGTVSSGLATTTISDSDCVIAFGASLNQFTAGSRVVRDPGSLFARKAVVQCDDDPARIGVVTPVTSQVIGDAATTARAMVDALRDAGIAKASVSRAQLKATLAAASPYDDFIDASDGDTVDPRTAMIRLDEVLPRERVVVTDAGRFVNVPWRFLHVDDPSCFVTTINFASIGLGISAAIGAAAARPDLLTVAVVGDGGFMMNVGEFSTAVRNGLRIVVVVVNDGAYGAEYRKLAEYGVDPAYSLIQWPEFASIAEGFGGRGITVRSPKEFETVADLLRESDLPLIVDVKVDPALDIHP